MVFARTLVFVLVLAAAVAGCSSDTPPGPTCDACKQDYYACSSPGMQEVAAFEITSRYEGGCSGNVEGAPMHLKCDPLEFCHDGTKTCQPVELTELGTLLFEDGGKCY